MKKYFILEKLETNLKMKFKRPIICYIKSQNSVELFVTLNINVTIHVAY